VNYAFDVPEWARDPEADWRKKPGTAASKTRGLPNRKTISLRQ